VWRFGVDIVAVKTPQCIHSALVPYTLLSTMLLYSGNNKMYLGKCKYHPVTCHEGVEVQLYSFFNFVAGWGEWLTPRPALYHREREQVALIEEAGWAPGPLCTDQEYLASTGIRCPDVSGCSKSQYRLRCPGPQESTEVFVLVPGYFARFYPNFFFRHIFINVFSKKFHGDPSNGIRADMCGLEYWNIEQLVLEFGVACTLIWSSLYWNMEYLVLGYGVPFTGM
jgi:hypothetical protein